MLPFVKFEKQKTQALNLNTKVVINVDLVQVRQVKKIQVQVDGATEKVLGIEGGLDFQDQDGFKNFRTRNVPVFLEGQYLPTCHKSTEIC